MSNDGYTQREWDRTVGWGKVPDEYKNISNRSTDAEDTQRSDQNKQEDERTLEDGKEYALNDPIWDKRWTEWSILKTLYIGISTMLLDMDTLWVLVIVYSTVYISREMEVIGKKTHDFPWKPIIGRNI